MSPLTMGIENQFQTVGSHWIRLLPSLPGSFHQCLNFFLTITTQCLILYTDGNLHQEGVMADPEGEVVQSVVSFLKDSRVLVVISVT